MIAIVIPAHNEEALIEACLASLITCASDPSLEGEDVRIIVVLDRCTDRTGKIARGMGAHCIELAAGNVGIARARGFEAAVHLGARWIASTDADTVVPVNWLSGQLSYHSDAYCGVVRVNDWSDYDDVVRDEFIRTECHHDEHPHVHGANFGVSADSYVRAGGFAPLPAHEDVALLQALEHIGARIARKIEPAVWTSARREARAAEGFSDYLKALEARLRASAELAVGIPANISEARYGI